MPPSPSLTDLQARREDWSVLEGLWLSGQWQAEPEQQLSEQLLFGFFPLPQAHLSRLLLSSWMASSVELGGSPIQPGGGAVWSGPLRADPAYKSHKEGTSVLKPQRFELFVAIMKPGQG